MIDMGTTTARVLHDNGVHVKAIDHFLITHSHADHIGGLEEVQLFNRYVARRKANMIITKQYESNSGTNRSKEDQSGRKIDVSVYLTCGQCSDPKNQGIFTGRLPNRGGQHFGEDVSHQTLPGLCRSWQDSVWSCGVT